MVRSDESGNTLTPLGSAGPELLKDVTQKTQTSKDAKVSLTEKTKTQK